MLVKELNYGYELYWVVNVGVVIAMAVCNFSYLKCLSLEKIAQEIEGRQNREKEAEMRENQ